MHLAMRNPYKSCTGLMRLRKVDVLVFNARVETTNVLFRGRKGMMQEHMCAQILPGHTNAHGGLEPRQTVLHKVTSSTLRWPTPNVLLRGRQQMMQGHMCAQTLPRMIRATTTCTAYGHVRHSEVSDCDTHGSLKCILTFVSRAY